MLITKRDGTKRDFDSSKIRSAISKANSRSLEMTEEEIDKIVASVVSKCENIVDLNVEQIQDLVEHALLVSKFKATAKQYILYRDQRTRIRQGKSKMMKEISKKLKGLEVFNSNANVDEESFGGRKGEADSILLKNYALDYCMSEKSKNNHLNNEIYIHDLDSYSLAMHNCMSVPFDDLLAHGFKIKQTDIRPAGSINTAFQLVAVIFQIQSLEQFGGVSATHLDWTMVPYVRKSFFKHYLFEYLKDTEEFYELDLDKLSDEELDDWVKANKDRYLKEWKLTKEDFYLENDKLDKTYYKKAFFETRRELMQAVEGMYHNLNSLQSRSGNQLPFSSLNYGTCTLPEGRLVIRALLEGSIKGIGTHHLTPIFPCGIFQYMKGINDKPGTPNYDLYKLALKSTAKRIYPNYVNCDWTNAAGYDKNDPRTYMSTMGCRTANLADINAEPGVNPQMKDGRGNICPVTIILPTLAMEAGRDVDCFMALLSCKIDEAKDMLIERFNFIAAQSPSAAKFMYGNNVMLGYHPEEGIISALKHGTLAIGQLGLAETLELLIGCNHTKPEGMELAKKIEQLYKDKCAVFKKQYKLNFGVYYSPAESLAYTAMTKFKEKYGEIKNVSDHEYFTNSMHIPVWENVDAFEKIDLESQLTGYSSAGCITYVELSSAAKGNLEALETLVNYAMEKDVPYFALNVPIDECLDCGYTDEFNDHCPECGSHHIQQLRRVTGYLSTDYHNFNYGKQKEVEERVKHI